MKEQKKNKAFRFRWYRRVGVMMWMIFSYLSLFAYIPDEIYVAEEGDRTAFARGLPIDVVEVEAAQPVFGPQRVGAAAENDGILLCRLFDLIPVKQVVVHDTSRQMVTAAGTNIGIYLKNSGVLVVECASFTNQSGALISPAAYRIRSGDII